MLTNTLRAKKVKELGLSKYVARINEMTCTPNVGIRTLSVVLTSDRILDFQCTNTKYAIKCDGVDSVRTT